MNSDSLISAQPFDELRIMVGQQITQVTETNPRLHRKFLWVRYFQSFHLREKLFEHLYYFVTLRLVELRSVNPEPNHFLRFSLVRLDDRLYFAGRQNSLVLK